MKKINIPNETSINIASMFLRICCALMLIHGWKKLSTFNTTVIDFDDPLHVGRTASLVLTIFAEFFCTLFVIVGLFMREALIPLIICMLVIVFIVDLHETLRAREAALMYLLLYLAAFYVGPGKYSLDNFVRK